MSSSGYGNESVALIESILATYGPAQDRVRHDVFHLTQALPSLKPHVDTYVSNEGKEFLLLAFTGTIPILYQRHEYHIPMELWVVNSYPMEPPLCYVRPTSNMEIRKGHKHVDSSGQCHLSYLKEWDSTRCNLVGLTKELQMIFASKPPVYTKSKEIIEKMKKTTITTSTSSLSSGRNGIEGSNIDVVGVAGYLPTRKEGEERRGVGEEEIIRRNELTFGSNGYVNVGTGTHHPHTHTHPHSHSLHLHQQRASSMTSLPTKTISTPIYRKVHTPTSMEATLPFISGAPGGVSEVEGVVGSIERVDREEVRMNRVVGGRNVVDDGVGSVHEVYRPIRSVSEPAGMRHNPTQVLTERVQIYMHKLLHNVANDINQYNLVQARLVDSMQRTAGATARIQTTKQSCTNVIRDMEYMKNNVEEWIEGIDGREPLDINDVVKPSDSISSQLYDLVSEDHAIQDTLYYIDKALEEGTITLKTHLKTVRALSRQQFEKRALSLKLYHMQQQQRQQQYGGGGGTYT